MASPRNTASSLRKGLDVSNYSIFTRISELDQINESGISAYKGTSAPPTQQTLLDLMVATSGQETLPHLKRKSPALSQRSHKQSSVITKTTFLNFKKKDALAKNELVSLGNSIKLQIEAESGVATIKPPAKKDRPNKLEASPKNQAEITQLKNRCSVKNYLSVTPNAGKLHQSSSQRQFLRPVKCSEDEAVWPPLGPAKSSHGKSKNKSSKKQSQEQPSPPNEPPRETKISINFSSKFKDKLRRDVL